MTLWTTCKVIKRTHKSIREILHKITILKSSPEGIKKARKGGNGKDKTASYPSTFLEHVKVGRITYFEFGF